MCSKKIRKRGCEHWIDGSEGATSADKVIQYQLLHETRPVLAAAPGCCHGHTQDGPRGRQSSIASAGLTQRAAVNQGR